MNDHQPPDPLLSRERILQEARAAADAYRRVVEEAGLTPQDCFERLRREQGAGAVERVRQRVDARLRDIEEQLHRDVGQAMPARPPPRRLPPDRSV